MPWVPVTPKPKFLAWNGDNIDEWRDRWPNAEVTPTGGVTYGPGFVAEVGGGMVEGGGLTLWQVTAADLAKDFDVVTPPSGAGDG
ncbi:hypothetical protein ACIBCH_41960 [Amycolatopsis thailandensis]|uniref:hypothetical protein n=1 Tax=Amycolatopsis thailandensis TaxID=589330 RepID=UPI0037B0C4AE